MSRDVTLPTSASERGELQQVQLCVTLAASGHVGWLRVRRSQFVRGENTNKQKKAAAAVEVVPVGAAAPRGDGARGDSWMLQCCTPDAPPTHTHIHTFSPDGGE